MRVLLWASSSRGLSVANAVVEDGHEVGVVIVPAAKSEIGHLIQRQTGAHVIEVKASPKHEVKIHEIGGMDIGIVSGFPYWIPPSLANSPRLGSVNLHGGPLPQFRGGSPISWQISLGRKVVELSVHVLEEQLDAGPVVLSDAFELGQEEDISHARLKSDAKFSELVARLLREPSLLTETQPQDHSKAAYWHQRSSEDSVLRWGELTDIQAVNLVRAVSPDYGGAVTYLGDAKVEVFRAAPAVPRLHGTPGRVVVLSSKANPMVVCRVGGLELLDYKICSTTANHKTPERLENGARLVPV